MLEWLDDRGRAKENFGAESDAYWMDKVLTMTVDGKWSEEI